MCFMFWPLLSLYSASGEIDVVQARGTYAATTLVSCIKLNEISFSMRHTPPMKLKTVLVEQHQ